MVSGSPELDEPFEECSEEWGVVSAGRDEACDIGRRAVDEPGANPWVVAVEIIDARVGILAAGVRSVAEWIACSALSSFDRMS